tara:strand:+ start:613 stop:906 length:294 start_codon:yes stop_codon:yes gene_type:complete
MAHANRKESLIKKHKLKGVNKPKKTPSHPKKSHVVLAEQGHKLKLIRFGEQGAKTNQTPEQRKAFKARHAKNIAKGKFSGAFWANKVKWSPSKTKNK